ncbi:MAG TPA: hypothetical protein VL485_30590 [Ktedonobacteraceae bacterium]|nr:hypothetical protein [Ktedonobacteraceae bacterium]
MQHRPRFWPLTFYLYTQRAGLSHRLRLRLIGLSEDERASIEYYETHTESHPRCFGVYQRLWMSPWYIYRPDIHGVVLDQQFFHGIPTTTALFSLGCTFVLVERKNYVPSIISNRDLNSV